MTSTPYELKVESLLGWAQGRGISTNGIVPGWIEKSHCTGMIARRNIRKGTVLANVPAKALVTVDSPVNETYKKNLKKFTVHGRLAAHLLLSRSDIEPWTAIMPTLEEMKEYMPLLWREEFKALLPPHTEKHMQDQAQKFYSDLAVCDEVLGSLPEGDDVEMRRNAFTWAWLMVNTRSFYWDFARSMPMRDRNDCLALCPVIDCFNHTSVSGEDCEVEYSAQGYSVIAGKDLTEGEEVFVTYGAYGNDYLLMEYGFVLPRNLSDSVPLEALLVPRLNMSVKEFLDEHNMMGKFVLDVDGFCWKTRCALSLIQLPRRRWDDVIGGQVDDDGRGSIIGQVILKETKSQASRRIEESESLQKCHAKVLLQERWSQIDRLATTTDQNG